MMTMNLSQKCRVSLFPLLLLFLLFSVGKSQDSCTSPLQVQPQFVVDTATLRCLPVWQSQGFILRYQQSSPEIWSFILSAPNRNGYIAIGFSPDGKMVGSDAVVGWVSGDGTGVVRKYFLGGTTTSSVTLESANNGGVGISNSSLASVSNQLYMAFQVTGQPSSNLIYAVGPAGTLPVGPKFQLSEHVDDTSTAVNYTSGQTQAQSSSDVLQKAHGLVAMLGWAILLPLGAMAARYLKIWDPFWFNSHVAIQLTGFSLGVAGIVTGFVLENHTGAAVDAHKAIGIVILVLGCLQATAVLIRPGKMSKVRKYWNWYHHNAGRMALILAVANVFYGIHLAAPGKEWYIGFGAALAALFSVSLVMEVRMWFLR